jgi:hypothetical protein
MGEIMVMGEVLGGLLWLICYDFVYLRVSVYIMETLR